MMATTALERYWLSEPFMEHIMATIDNFSSWNWMVDLVFPESACKAEVFCLHLSGKDGPNIELSDINVTTANRTSVFGSIRLPCTFTHNEFAKL